MRKVVFFDVYGGDEAYFKRVFKNVFSSQIICTKEPLNEVTAKKYADTEVASVFVTSDINQQALGRLSELEFVATRSTGYDHIDTKAAKKQHVLVSNVPAYGESTVAEFTIMLLLALSRRLLESMHQVQSGMIDYPLITGFDVAGKSIGLIGCGRIGRQVARIARSLDMQVIGYDPAPVEDENIEYVELKELLETSDVVSLHMPYSKDNHHFINARKLKKMKKGVVFINTARGDLVDTSALIEALFSGHVAAAGLDVLEGEQLLRFDEEMSLLHPNASKQDLFLSAEHGALLRMPNVIVTPHNGFNSEEALMRIRETTAQNIKKYLMQEPVNLVS